MTTRPPTNNEDERPKRFIFTLLEEFSLQSFSGAIDSLRIANRAAGRTLYNWKLAGENPDGVTCSAGILIPVDCGLEELGRDDTILLCGGIDIGVNSTQKIINWLRREARRGVRIGGLCTAAHTMAMAGLLDDKRATIHWENQDSFGEEF